MSVKENKKRKSSDRSNETSNPAKIKRRLKNKQNHLALGNGINHENLEDKNDVQYDDNIESTEENKNVSDKEQLEDDKETVIENNNTSDCENEDEEKMEVDKETVNENNNTSESENESEEKLEDVVIDMKSFRSDLSTEAALTALRRFIRASRKTVSEYLQSGGNAFEILSAIAKTDRKNNNEAEVVFEAFQRVLFEIIANYAHLIPNAIEACRYLMNTYMNVVHSMLGSTSSQKQRKTVLKLLTSIVSLNSLLGRDILGHLSLHIQLVQMLAAQVNPMDKGSVRVCFIHFLMSFLVEGDLPLMRQFLSRKGILSSIMPDLIYDLPSTVNLVLTTIKTHILQNINISKTLKMCTFNNYTIQHLVKLYDWLGPQNFSKVKEHKKSKIKHTIKEVHPDDKEIVLNSVHDFMIILCTSYKYGIAFHSKAFNITKSNNPLLSVILKSIEKPWDNEKKGDLVIASLGTCLDLYQNYIVQISPYFEPRNSIMWLKSMYFMNNLITHITPDKLIKNNETINIKRFSVNAALVYLPETILKYFNNDFFCANKDPAVEYHALRFLQTLMKQIGAALNYLRESNYDITIYQNYIVECMNRLMPSAEIILSCWLITSKIKIDNENDEEVDIKLPLLNERKELVLDLLIYYYTYNSVAFQSISMDLDSEDILEKIDNFDKTIDSVSLKTLELLLQVNIKEFAPNTSLFDKTFLLLLEHCILQNDNQKQVKDLIIKLLSATGLYEGNKAEIEIWLYSFKHVDDIYKRDVINFFYEVIKKTNKDTLKYYKKLTELKKRALIDDADCAVIQKSAYDDIFDNIENMNHTTCESLEINNLSPVHICAFEQYQKEKYKEMQGLDTYLSFVSLYLFHNQNSYKVISYSIENCNFPINEEYFQSWISLDDIKPLRKVCKDKTILCKIDKAILSEESVDIYKIFGLQKCDENTENSFNVLGELTVMEKDLDNIEILCLLNMCIFYTSRLAQTSKLTETIMGNIEKVYLALYDIVLHQKKAIVLQTVKLLLTNAVILQFFNPISKKKNNCNHLITTFLIKFVKHLNDNVTLYNEFLSRFRLKSIRSLKKAIEKQSALKNDEIIDILETLNITFDESSDLLSNLSELDYTNFVSTENDVSNWCKVLIFAINKTCSLSVQEEKIDKIPTTTSSNLVELYIGLKTKIEVEINFDILEDSLHRLLLTFPQTIPDFSGKLKSMLNSKRISKSTAKLISFCLERDWQQSGCITKYINKQENISKREVIFPLLTAALNNNFDDISIFQKVFDEHKASILKVIEKPHKAGQVYKENYKMLSYMINKCMDIPTCSTFTNKIMKFETSEVFHINILHEIFLKINHSKPKEKKYLENYFIVFIMFLNILLRREQIDIVKIRFVLDKIMKWTTLIKDEKINYTNILKHSCWETFCKLSLKNGLRLVKHSDSAEHSNGILLKALAYLCKILYQESSDDACVVFQMAVSHSEFLNVMLEEKVNDTKTNLLELMWCVVQKNPSVMNKSHVPVYLGAYHASLTKSDRLILALLQFYEKSGISLYEYRPFIWGEAAVNHYSIRGTRNNLWRQPSMNEILDLLDSNMVNSTIKKFPFWRGMDAIEQVNDIEDMTINGFNNLENRVLEKYIDRVILDKDQQSSDRAMLVKLLEDKNNMTTCSSDWNNAGEVYDPAFFLPLFALLFAPEAAPATGKAAVSGVTAMIWRAIGSSQPDTRATACLAISRLRGHIDAQRNTKDKNLWLQLIDFVRKAMSEDQDEDSDFSTTPSLSSITSLFLARTSKVLTQPLNNLYNPLTNYLLVKEKIELKTVPEMLLLLHSPNPEYKVHRIWMLELLRDGLKTYDDFEVLLNSCAYRMIMDFYGCTLCNRDCKILILGIINNTIKIPKAAKILTEGHGLLPWLLSVIIALNQTNNDLISAVVMLINNLRCSLTSYKISESFSKTKVMTINDFELSEHTIKFLCNLLNMLSQKLNSRMNAKTMVKYLKTSFYLTRNHKIFDENVIVNLINICESIFKQDSDCKILLKTNSNYSEPIVVLVNSILYDEEDEIEQYGIKYLKLLVRSWIKMKNS